MSAVTKLYITESDYLEQERLATHKSEYYQGEIFAMAGATKEHNKVVASIIVELGQYLKGKKCSVMPSDIRVYNELNTLYTYPDIVITCGEEKYLDDQFDTLLKIHSSHLTFPFLLRLKIKPNKKGPTIKAIINS